MYEFLMSETTKKYRDIAREAVKAVDSQYLKDMDQEKVKYPKELLKHFAKYGLLGTMVPKEYGGQGLLWETDNIIMEEIGTLGYIVSCATGVTGALVPAAITAFGTEEQKRKYLPGLCKAEIFGAECLTEPRGGSDLFGSTTAAVRDGDDWILNGQKRFIVGGEGADIFLVYACTDPEAHAKKRLTVFIVERDMGVKTDYLYNLMGCHGGGTARLVFDNVRVPKENVLGEVNGAYDVYEHMMIPERFGTAAMTIGATRPAVEIATDYTAKRKAFGQVLNRYQAVSFKVAECAMMLDVCRSYIYTTAKAVQTPGLEGQYVRRLCSQSKKFVTETCKDIANKCMQVMGGIAYTDVYPIEKIVRDLGLATIWTGSNEVMSLICQKQWYTERKAAVAAGLTRDCEFDCVSAIEGAGEKDYGT